MSPRVRKITYPPELLEAWQEGAREFNEGRFWEAHESWEQGWKGLLEPERSWVQAWIQLAAAIHLKQRGRNAPARALCLRALEKLEHSGALNGAVPRLEIRGGQAFLRRSARLEKIVDGSWVRLRARVVLC